MKLVARNGLYSLAILLVLSVFQIPRVGATDNVDYVGTYDPRPVFSELLDCEYRLDTLFVAGVSGFTIVDVADKGSPRLIGRYTPPGHPFERYYHIAVAESVAYGFARDDGIAIIDFSRPTQPSRIDNFNPGGIAFEDGQIHEGKLFATAHSEGLFIFHIEGDGRLQLIKQYKGEPENATALALVDSLAYIADGSGGVLVLNVKDPSSPTFVSRVSTTSAAQDIGFYGNYAAVAVGAEGVDLIDFSNPASPQLVSNYQGLGSAFNLSAEDSLVYLARWKRVEVINIADPLNPTLAGWEDTPNRAMGLTVNNSFIYVA
ncbi:MAG: LVIVD repeat-containing protein, partial [Candidatus Zixiibacteriota bacterium]